jgi:hypothetical protein
MAKDKEKPEWRQKTDHNHEPFLSSDKAK